MVCSQMADKSWRQACSGCKGRFPIEGGNDVTLTHRVTRETSKAGGAHPAPRGLFDQKRHELGGGQVCREISEVSRGHPENKRTATYCTLTWAVHGPTHSPGLQQIKMFFIFYRKQDPQFSTTSILKIFFLCFPLHCASADSQTGRIFL